MELEHVFHQSGYLVALQLFVGASLLAPGVVGGIDMYRRFVSSLATHVVSFGPMGLLVYMLYRISLLS
jgi:hypothetical protein